MNGMTLFDVLLDAGFWVSLLLTLGNQNSCFCSDIWSAKRRKAGKYLEKGNFWHVNKEGKGRNYLERENECRQKTR